MLSRSSIALSAAAMLAVTLLAAAPLAQQREHAETPREQWQRVPDILRELGAVPGAHIADLGAGSGFFTTRIAKAVGPDGHVYALIPTAFALRIFRVPVGLACLWWLVSRQSQEFQVTNSGLILYGQSCPAFFVAGTGF